MILMLYLLYSLRKYHSHLRPKIHLLNLLVTKFEEMRHRCFIRRSLYVPIDEFGTWCVPRKLCRCILKYSYIRQEGGWPLCSRRHNSCRHITWQCFQSKFTQKVCRLIHGRFQKSIYSVQTNVESETKNFGKNEIQLTRLSRLEQYSKWS